MERKVVLVVMGLALLLGSAAQALIITTADGSGADTFVGNDSKMSSTSTSGASASAMECRYNGGGSRFRCMYLRFDVSAETGDFAGSTLMFDATYIKSSTGRQLDVYGLVDESLDSWDEASTSYQNAPGMLEPASGWNAGDYLIDESKLVHLGFFNTPGTNGETVTYPITFSSNTTDLGTAFSDFLASDTNGLVTLVVINSTGTSSVNCEDKIATKEHGTFIAPTLITPEPAGLALLGIGSLLSLRRRHR